MGKVCLGCAGRFGYGAAQLAASELLDNAERKLRDMLGHFYAHIRCYAECRHVRAHKPGYIHQNGSYGKKHGHPAVMRYVNRFTEIRCNLYYFLEYSPYVPERHERYERAHGGKHPRKIAQYLSVTGIAQQPAEIGLFLQMDCLPVQNLASESTAFRY